MCNTPSISMQPNTQDTQSTMTPLHTRQSKWTTNAQLYVVMETIADFKRYKICEPPTVKYGLKALCHDIRHNCFLMSSLVQKLN